MQIGGRRKYDVAVVGGGLIGLATASALLRERPRLRVVVLEKEREVAQHQSGRNSGVMHAGLYYAPESLKAQLCREGLAALMQFADEHDIPYEICGKLVVALERAELPRLDELERRGRANGIRGLRRLCGDEMREREPHVAGVEALLVPETGIVDFRRVARAYAAERRELRRRPLARRACRRDRAAEPFGGGPAARRREITAGVRRHLRRSALRPNRGAHRRSR